MNDMALCGSRTCKSAHPAQPFVERQRDLTPLARRIAAIQPVPEAPDRQWKPAWLRNLKPADKTEWSPR